MIKSLSEGRSGISESRDGPSEGRVELSEIAEIELFVLKRMRELTLGDHASVYKGAGFNFVDLRDWEPGDRPSSIDWAQSSLSNFSPMVSREYEQNSTSVIVALADASMSTRCGAQGILVARAIARSVASVGLSALLFQDSFGLVTFDDDFHELESARPRIGKPHVLHCVDIYQERRDDSERSRQNVVTAVHAQLRRTAVVPVISDFLFEDPSSLISELALLNAVHDVFLMMVDVGFAYRLPEVSAGWIEAFDVETGRERVFSRAELGRLADRVDVWQEEVAAEARDEGLDVVRVGLDRWAMENALVEFLAARRLRKV
ncbi:MAG: DUF58 domain-containing protein [Acidobacteriota bacterium]|nr:DUF58 domain-containing protein [Acidobacteriota bacterium]